MKIESVDVHVLKMDLAQPFAFSQGWVTQRSATLVCIRTDDGIEGWGEAFAQGLEAPELSAAVIRHALVPKLLRRNALDRRVIWHDLYHACRDFARTGSGMSAISAIDIALWDIAGKAAGQPIYQLLGGASRNSVQPYATGFYRIGGQGEAERLADEALAHQEAGFGAMKVKLGFGVRDDIAVMNRIRQVLPDESVDWMIDTNHAYGRADALKLGLAMQEHQLRWYEEPVVPEDVEGYRWLRERLSMPIAGGENEHAGHGFNRLFRADAVDIAQPDIGSCGGFTALSDIAALAQANGVQVNPHVWGSAIAQAASLQMIAALPVTHHALFPPEPILEYDRSSHPFRTELVDLDLSIHDGRVAIPSGPGLGVEVNREVVERYRENG